MTWTVSFFNSKVKEETLKFPIGILSNLLHILEIIEEFGPAVGKPYTTPMGNGLFEIRAKGKEGIGRSLFCIVKGKEVIILNSFIKKSQKTPRKELDKARKRIKDLQND
ncbi:type II toxin-antitoxin system RelE/ParE family toxin [Gammaproteobacteria bacterium]|nr:type II toxin-antitoxin system RelE/ParE family toxin [Gammaproteobacteria bacterium]